MPQGVGLLEWKLNESEKISCTLLGPEGTNPLDLVSVLNYLVNLMNS